MLNGPTQPLQPADLASTDDSEDVTVPVMPEFEKITISSSSS